MPMQTNIHAEPDTYLTAAQELALMRKAYARSGSANLRERLARMLQIDEAFDEVIALLEPCNDLDFNAEMVLAQASLARETPADNVRVMACANRAIAIASDKIEYAQALATRGKAEMRLGDPQAARASLEQALELDPASKDACKRLAALDLAEGRHDNFLVKSEELLANGGGHARLFAGQTVAHARAGNAAAARLSAGHPELFLSQILPPPKGWDSIEAFNAALAEELLEHPGMRYERYGSASVKTWRIENVSRRDTPLFKLLLGEVRAALDRYDQQIGGSAHPWRASRPAEALLRIWCVITESDGFEDWHVHQFGWASGVYYVQVPDSIAKGHDKGGCLAFGLPPDLAGEDGSAQFGERLTRPQSGLFLAFPSHTYHRTYPHGTGEKRICVAFDVRPM